MTGRCGVPAQKILAVAHWPNVLWINAISAVASEVVQHHPVGHGSVGSLPTQPMHPSHLATILDESVTVRIKRPHPDVAAGAVFNPTR